MNTGCMTEIFHIEGERYNKLHFKRTGVEVFTKEYSNMNEGSINCLNVHLFNEVYFSDYCKLINIIKPAIVTVDDINRLSELTGVDISEHLQSKTALTLTYGNLDLPIEQLLDNYFLTHKEVDKAYIEYVGVMRDDETYKFACLINGNLESMNCNIKVYNEVKSCIESVKKKIVESETGGELLFFI